MSCISDYYKYVTAYLEPERTRIIDVSTEVLLIDLDNLQFNQYEIS